MYEQKNIILDGEILGSNVIINTKFDLIYNISPLIIKNFIKVINETSFVLKPVRIKKYEFIQNNCINIHFKNKLSSGEIQLAYVLNKYNELLIDTYTITITEGENKGCSIAKQNSKAKLILENNVQKQFDIYQSEEEFVEISTNNEKDSELEENELVQIEDENVENFEQIIDEERVSSIEEILNETYESEEILEENENNDINDSIECLVEENEIEVEVAATEEENELEEKCEKGDEIEVVDKENESDSSIEEDEVENILLEQDVLEEDIVEEKELVSQESESVEVNNNYNSGEMNSINQRVESFNLPIQDSVQRMVMSESGILENSLLNDSVITNDSLNQLESNSNVDKIPINEQNIDYENYEVNNSNDASNLDNLDLEINNTTNEEKEIEYEKEINSSDIINTGEEAEETKNKCYQEIEESVFVDEKLNNIDLVDFFDTIPKILDDYSEKEGSFEEDNFELISDEDDENLIDDCFYEQMDEKDSLIKKYAKNIKLNREEKVALYQNILKGYDNEMTEKKLSSFKEKIKAIQKDENLSIEDVLNAQVELLVDNKSKAFRILDSNLKQDVIKLDDDLFISKDKIYTLGDVYILDW